MAGNQKRQGQDKVVNLPITQLKIPPQDLMPRVIGGINEDIVSRYADYMRAGQDSQFWPLEVWEKSKGEYWIVSGIHRYRAAVEVGITEIPCLVRGDITERNFLMEAFLANLGHGYAYEPGERREVVRILYRRGYSVREIHEKTGLPERTLRLWVLELGEERRKERDERIIRLAQLGRTQAEIAEELGVGQGTVSKVLTGQNNLQNIPNGKVAVWNKAQNGSDTKQLREDSESEGLNIYPFFVKSNPSKKGSHGS